MKHLSRLVVFLVVVSFCIPISLRAGDKGSNEWLTIKIKESEQMAGELRKQSEECLSHAKEQPEFAGKYKKASELFKQASEAQLQMSHGFKTKNKDLVEKSRMAFNTFIRDIDRLEGRKSMERPNNKDGVRHEESKESADLFITSTEDLATWLKEEKESVAGK